jgi:sterol 3beta-glucosyltransferase
LTHLLFRRLVWLAARTAAHELRDRIGLPRWNGAKAAWAALEMVPAFCAVSPTLVPRPADWPATAAMTGFLFLDTEQEPDPALRAFVEGGEPPVYLGFGSMVARDPIRTAEACVAAVRHAGRRAVVVTGWGGLAPGPLLAARDRGMTLHVTESVPHTWLLPRIAAAVHHGGAGTSAAAARAGVPSVVVPFLGDQFFWAARLRAAGAAPPAVPVGRLTGGRLEAALAQALADAAMRDRAAALGRAIRTENGIAGAVGVVERAIAVYAPGLYVAG